MKFIIRWVREKGETIVRLKDTPLSIARGVAIGTFFGFVPVVGLKTLISMGVARLSKSNVVSAAIAVTLHDLVLPLAPLIFKWEYELGHWIIGGANRVPSGHQEGFKFSQLLHWATAKVLFFPALLGSIFFGAPFAIAGYWISKAIMIKIRLRQAAEESKEL